MHSHDHADGSCCAKSSRSCLKLIIAVAVTVLATDFLIHQVMLRDMYIANASLWRAESDMPAFMPMIFLGQALIAIFFSVIFMHGYKGTGWKEGLRYGLFVGGMNTGCMLIMHAVHPYPTDLTVAWVGFGLVQTVILGIVAALVTDCAQKKI